MDLQLQDKMAVVTGSTAGIGRAIAAGLAAEGARVVVNGREQERTEKVAAEIAMLPLEDGEAPEAAVEGGEEVEVEGDECTMCGEDATEVAYFAKTY